MEFIINTSMKEDFIQIMYGIHGEKDKAKEMFDSLIKNGNHLGLFSEDIDLKTNQITGNFPQAYTHIAIINTAIMLSEWSTSRKKIDYSYTKLKPLL